MFSSVGWLICLKIRAKYSVLILALFMELILDAVMAFAMTSVMTGWALGLL
jgi:hypothetical protein